MRIRRLLLFAVIAAAWSLSALEPIAIATMNSGAVAVLDQHRGIVKYFGVSWLKNQPVSNFGVFEASDFTTDGDSFFVSLAAPTKSNDPFARIAQWTSSGTRVHEWKVGGMGITLAGIAVDPKRQILYCIDARAGEVFQLDLRNPRATFVSLVRIADPGVLTPLFLDVAGNRLLLGDARKGRILALRLSDKRVDVLVDTGTILEPVAMAIDAQRRLYIADASKQRVWVGSLASPKLTLTAFAPSESFEEPIGVAVGPDGTIWVADRDERELLQFRNDGRRLRKIKLD
jgi:hypothetical protein